jgi:hypothetical protein
MKCKVTPQLTLLASLFPRLSFLFKILKFFISLSLSFSTNFVSLFAKKEGGRKFSLLSGHPTPQASENTQEYLPALIHHI